MPLDSTADVNVSPGLLAAVASFPLSREVRHCGRAFRASPLDIYATCPACGGRLKVRAFAAGGEVEDVFDAVLAWMLQPGAAALVRDRQAALAADADAD